MKTSVAVQSVAGGRNPRRSAGCALHALALGALLAWLTAASGCATKPRPAVLGLPEGFYGQVAFSPDGRCVAAASQTAPVAVVFDVTNRLETTRFKPSGETKPCFVEDLAYRPDGHLMVAVVTEETTKVWDASAGEVLLCRPQLKPPCNGALSADGSLLAVSGKDQPPIIWDITTGTKIAELKDLTQPVWRMVFSPDHRWLATADYQRNIEIWDATLGTWVGSLPRPDQDVEGLAFSPDGNQLAVSACGVSVWQRQTGEKLQTMASPTLSTGARVAGATWSLVAIPAAIFSGNPSLYAPALPSSVNAGIISFSPSLASGSVQFSPDGNRLAMVNLTTDLNAALGFQKTQVRVFDLTAGELVSAVAHGGLMWRIAFSPNGRLLATAGKGVEVWDWQKAQVQKGTDRPTGYGPFILLFETNVVVKPSAPLARLAPKRIRVASLADERPLGPLGFRSAAFGVKLNEIFSQRPPAERLRDALQHLCVRCGHTLVEDAADFEISGTLKTFSVETPVSLTTWKVNAVIALELRVTNRQGVTVHSATYRGQASRKTFTWMSEGLVRKDCNEALANLLTQIASDPKWTQLE